MKSKKETTTCKKCNITYWRQHTCRFDRKDNRDKQQKVVDTISNYGLEPMSFRTCERCKLKYVVNPVSTEYHNTKCKIKILGVVKYE